MICFYGEYLLAARPIPIWMTTLCRCPLIQYIRSYTPYYRPFLHPQPENAPCRGESDPLKYVYQKKTTDLQDKVTPVDAML
jgi:hypothetical protein